MYMYTFFFIYACISIFIIYIYYVHLKELVDCTENICIICTEHTYLISLYLFFMPFIQTFNSKSFYLDMSWYDFFDACGSGDKEKVVSLVKQVSSLPRNAGMVTMAFVSHLEKLIQSVRMIQTALWGLYKMVIILYIWDYNIIKGRLCT